MNACALRNIIVGAGIALSALLAGCSSRGLDNLMTGNPSSRHVWQKPGDRISIPFEWHDGHLMIPVRVNGSADLRFAFDTGAAATVVFETERTQSLGLDIEQSIRIGEDAGFQGTLVDIVNDATISLDGIRLTGMTILHVALANSHLFGSLDEAYFDGAIGYDLLRRFVTEIDYVNRTITFSRARESRAFDPPWQTLPIDVSGRVPVITAQLRGEGSSQESVGLILDSGAPFYLYLNPDLTEGVGIPLRHSLMRGKGFYGPIERITGRVAKFSIGRFAFDDQVTYFDRADFKDLPKAIGLIGNGVLRNFDLVLDYSAREVSMRPIAGFDTGSVADRSGINLLPHRSGAYAQSVVAGSPADGVGLRSGDVVTHLDGERIERSSFDALKERLSSDREAVDICWRSAAGEVCERLPLSDRL
ncbi:aspartyl protease family protein [Luteimonas salinilitoris]|uniref:Aspartyl protease family protein n=1 Tax=Luteimonas salinilitoris TaxID=3237697 RepID=A0ABV4HX21_9GAMM